VKNIKADLWFQHEEYCSRISKIQHNLNKRNLDALLVFFPENVTWTTGFYTRGYASFQFIIIPASGEPHLFCRDVEEFYIKKTFSFSNYSLWCDSDDKVKVATSVIRKIIGKGASVAIEEMAWSLSANRYEKIKENLKSYKWQDGSNIIVKYRLIKSEAEIQYQKKAAFAAEMGMKAAVECAVSGATEREMAAYVCSAMILNGSDRAGPGVLSSGERAMYLHGGYTDRIFKKGDKIQLETTPHVRNYHARFMRPIMVEECSEKELRFVESLIEIQNNALEEVKPGISAKIPDKIYRDGILTLDNTIQYTNKTFYSIGLLMEPSGGEPLEAHPKANWNFKENMMFHTYLLVNGFGMSETIRITSYGFERITQFPRKLLIGGQSL